jgi:hypothetical protein
LEQVVRLPSVWEKTSEERRAFMRVSESQCVGIVGGVVRDAVACGDLQLPGEVAPEAVVFGLWSMTFGAQTISLSGTSLEDIGIKEAVAALRHNQMMLLDGYGWRPLTRDYDFDAVSKRLREEVFADELRRVEHV